MCSPRRAVPIGCCEVVAATHGDCHQFEGRRVIRLKVCVATWLLLAATGAQAMGGRPAVSWAVGCGVALGGSSIAVVLSKASPLGKLLALLLIGMGAAAVWGLSRAPEYSTYETWINAASALCTAVSIYASRLALRLSRT